MKKNVIVIRKNRSLLTNGGGNMSESNEESIIPEPTLEEKLSWYERYFGEKHPAVSDEKLTIQRGETVEVIVLSDGVGEEVKGDRTKPYIRVLTSDGTIKKLYLTKKSLAVKIGYLQTRYDRLRGLKLRITAPDPDNGQRYYNVEVIGKVENINELPQ